MVFTGTSAWPGWPALWLLPIGVLAAAGQLCMTRAYSTAKTSRGTLVVANLQYSGIVFAAIYSVVLFNDQIPPIGWLGMVLIVGSGIVASVLRARPAPDRKLASSTSQPPPSTSWDRRCMSKSWRRIVTVGRPDTAMRAWGRSPLGSWRFSSGWA